MSIRYVLGSRASIGGPLGSGRGGAATLPDWAIAGGVATANVIACYQPKGAASLAASYVNLANPGTYDANPVVAPTIGANGWIANGSAYLSVSITIQSGISYIVRVTSTGYQAAGNIIGAYGGSGSVELEVRRVDVGGVINYAIGNIATNRLNIAPALSSDILCITSAGVYRNGTSIATWTPNWSNGALPLLAIMARRRHDTSGYDTILSNATIQAAAIYSVTLSAAQVAAISSAMAAL